MRIPIAWKIFPYNKTRLVASLAGVCFAIVLTYLQLGFYDSCFRSATMLFDKMAFKIALVSPEYIHFRAPSAFPRERLQQSLAVPGVRSAAPCYVENSTYRNRDDLSEKEVVVLGFDPATQPFRLPELMPLTPLLKQEDAGVMDSTTGKGYGPIEAGTSCEIGDHRIDIADTYDHGAGFIAEATVLVSDQTLSRMSAGRPLSHVNIGLIQLEPDVSVAATARALRAALPADVRVLRRAEVEANEQNFYVRIKPLGVMFSAGVVLALLVGAVIIYQILSSEISNQINEYATLKAIGYQDGFMRWIVLQQAAIFALFGYVPATLLAFVMFDVTREATNVPMYMTLDRILFVLVLTLVMCATSALLVTRKVSKADPTDLF